MKNHFIISYVGNKRMEIDNIIKVCNFNNITTIIEPYCGSCCFSYYVSTLYPKKFKYILNDNNSHLIELLNILKDEKKTLKLIETCNKIIDGINNKESYNKIKDENNLTSWLIMNKYYSIRAGLYPYNKKKIFFLNHYPIIDFLRNEEVIIKHEDALNVFNSYKNDSNNLIFLDPPYLQTTNDFYLNSNTNIYEYLYKNPPILNKAFIVFTFEDIWIIRLLFKDIINNNITFKKKYQQKKRNTTHIYFNNKNFHKNENVNENENKNENKNENLTIEL